MNKKEKERIKRIILKVKQNTGISSSTKKEILANARSALRHLKTVY